MRHERNANVDRASNHDLRKTSGEVSVSATRVQTSRYEFAVRPPNSDCDNDTSSQWTCEPLIDSVSSLLSRRRRRTRRAAPSDARHRPSHSKPRPSPQQHKKQNPIFTPHPIFSRCKRVTSLRYVNRSRFVLQPLYYSNTSLFAHRALFSASFPVK